MSSGNQQLLLGGSRGGETFISATGGTVDNTVVVSGVNYTTHTFTSTGSSTFTVNSVGANSTVEYLIVAGGGGGADDVGGGGGAGGLLFNSTTVTAQAYNFTVGAGGTAGTGTFSTVGVQPTPGGNSVALGFTAIGGGVGAGRRDGSAVQNVAGSGGSGGGGAYPGTSGGNGTAGQGNNGGTAPSTSNGGGGGGAGSAGSGQTAGAGLSNSISGSPVIYSVGGGGGFLGGGGGTSSTDPGSGGAGGGNSPIGTSGAGRNGIIIIRYRRA
jgi:hypothetical protein